MLAYRHVLTVNSSDDVQSCLSKEVTLIKTSKTTWTIAYKCVLCPVTLSLKICFIGLPKGKREEPLHYETAFGSPCLGTPRSPHIHTPLFPRCTFSPQFHFLLCDPCSPDLSAHPRASFPLSRLLCGPLPITLVTALFCVSSKILPRKMGSTHL